MKLSIVVVNYNSGALTHTCLESVLRQPLPANTEIVVIDNASTDDSVSFLRSDFPEIRVIANDQNVGLAAAVNRALGATHGEYCLVLNPDIIALPGAVVALLDFMSRHVDVGIAGGKLLSPNGVHQPSAFRFYTPLTVLYRRTRLGRTARGQRAVAQFLLADQDLSTPRDVDWLMGSCLVLRRSAVDQVGGMDEQFFLYFEDVDWCRRFWKKGWRVTYVPTARFSHFHQQSSRQHALLGLLTNWTAREHVASALKYFYKYWREPSPRPAIPAA